MSQKVFYAGHGDKALTCEVSNSGVAFLHIRVGDEKTVITLTQAEKGALADALFKPGQTTEITEY